LNQFKINGLKFIFSLNLVGTYGEEDLRLNDAK